MSSSGCGRSCRLVAAAGCSIILAAVTACSPAPGGPPNINDVEAYLGLALGHLPDGCTPEGLDGDGRGRVLGATFMCPAGTELRIQRFDSTFDGRELPASPSQTAPNRFEWRDQATDDVIRVVSDDLAVDVLRPIADAIEVHATGAT
jgi:hypothetical protein